MILLIDAGNTRVKIAWRAPGAPQRAAPPLILDHASLPDLATHLDFTPHCILGSNVAGNRVRDTLEHVCRTAWDLPVHWCSALDGHDQLRNGYHAPGQLGADRWLGLLGLLHHVQDDPDWLAGAPCILASFGTATTIDTLAWQDHDTGTRQPAFVGGLILPGAALMARSLYQDTADLPLAQGEPTDFPTDTNAAIISGIAGAQVGALLRQYRLAAALRPAQSPLIFVSGGDWPRVQKELQMALQGTGAAAPRWLDSPVLDGLATLAARVPGNRTPTLPDGLPPSR